MNSVSVSDAALDMVVEKLAKHEAIYGGRFVPQFLWTRVLTEQPDGSMAEQGRHLFLFFYDDADDAQHWDFLLRLEDGRALNINSDLPLDQGMHFIDWVDREFRLTSIGV